MAWPFEGRFLVFGRTSGDLSGGLGIGGPSGLNFLCFSFRAYEIPQVSSRLEEQKADSDQAHAKKNTYEQQEEKE